jgi:cobalt/nickel transport system ATP-binding protein
VAEPVVTAQGLRVQYPDGRTVAIEGLPFVVEPGERIALLGPNGSGKSTLLRAVLGLVRPIAGEVRVFGRDPVREFEQVRARLGAVLQDVDAQLLAPTVGEDLAFGLAGKGHSALEVGRRVQEIAQAYDLTLLLEQVPHYLSGGERRKLALAGALITEPELLVLDEPFASLDPRSRAELSQYLRQEHQRREMAFLLTTHEIEELPELVDTVYVLSGDGELVARGTPDEVFGMHDVLVACNVAPPMLVRLVEALRARGAEVPVANDPETMADALIAWREGIRPPPQLRK